MTDTTTTPPGLLADLNLDTIGSRPAMQTHLQNFLRYASHKIQDQALPDAYDGLLPSQRFHLLSMMDIDAKHNNKRQKATRVVAQSTGAYHPVGNTYDVLVNMSQPWRVPALLTDPEGNWGEPDNGVAAAERYTEIRLSRFGQEVCFGNLPGARRTAEQDPHGIVPAALTYTYLHWLENYLPVRFPLLLLNGSNGIAVGLAQTWQPLAFKPLMGELLRFIKEGKIQYENLRPGYPSKPLIATTQQEFIGALQAGRGSIRTVAKLQRRTLRNGNVDAIIAVSLPPGVTYNAVGDAFNEWRTSDPTCPFSSFDNESGKGTIKLTFNLKSSTKDTVLLAQYELALYKKQLGLSETQTVNMQAIKGRYPVQYTFESLLADWVVERKAIIQRLAIKRLGELGAVKHRLDLMVWTRTHLDEVIPIIRSSKYEDVILTCFKDIEGGEDLTADDVEVILTFNLRQLSNVSEADLLERLAKNATEMQNQIALRDSDPWRTEAMVHDLTELAEKAKAWGIESHDCEFSDEAAKLLAPQPVIPGQRRKAAPTGPWTDGLRAKGETDIILRTAKGAVLRISTRSVRSTPYTPDLVDPTDRIISATFNASANIFFLVDDRLHSLPQNDLPVNQPIYPQKLAQLMKYKGEAPKLIVPVPLMHPTSQALVLFSDTGKAKRIQLKGIPTLRSAIQMEGNITAAAFIGGLFTTAKGDTLTELNASGIISRSTASVGHLTKTQPAWGLPSKVDGGMFVAISADGLSIYKKTTA
jgi:DNA gyrase/topoisomerase IV subunit A